jgi:hypothetical protein
MRGLGLLLLLLGMVVRSGAPDTSVMELDVR